MHYQFYLSCVRPAAIFLTAASCVVLTAGDSSGGPASNLSPADPFVGAYGGTFQPQGWSAGFGRKARFDKPEEIDAMERAGIDPGSLKPEEAFASYAATEAPGGGTPVASAGYGGPASPAGTKPHRCAACHTAATVERTGGGYQLVFQINHGKDKEGKTILVRRTVPGTVVAPDQIVFSNEKYRVELNGGELSGRFTGLMISKIKLHRTQADEAALENGAKDKPAPAKGENG